MRTQHTHFTTTLGTAVFYNIKMLMNMLMTASASLMSKRHAEAARGAAPAKRGRSERNVAHDVDAVSGIGGANPVGYDAPSLASPPFAPLATLATNDSMGGPGDEGGRVDPPGAAAGGYEDLPHAPAPAPAAVKLEPSASSEAAARGGGGGHDWLIPVDASVAHDGNGGIGTCSSTGMGGGAAGGSGGGGGGGADEASVIDAVCGLLRLDLREGMTDRCARVNELDRMWGVIRKKTELKMIVPQKMHDNFKVDLVVATGAARSGSTAVGAGAD